MPRNKSTPTLESPVEPRVGRQDPLEKQNPRYREVANELMERITAGTYAVGSLLPTESDLTGMFKVSRYTVREAVRRLQTKGLVERRQGHGTVVKSDRSRSQFKLAIRTLSDIENHGYFTQLVVQLSEIIAADSDLAIDLPCEKGARFLHIVSRREPIDDTVPLPTAWNETYIIEEYSDIRNEIGKHKGPVYNLIEHAYNEHITAIEQDVSAVEVDAAVAKVLGLRGRTPALRIKRTYSGRRGRTVMVAFNIYPPEPFTFNMRLERSEM